ncbi:hybrid sensor histidine kinase/response regulator [Desulfatirhabdium butyrativorans]|uniref:hybrid sensor histidine kinase/response regulator n=1 Tax=Desulfatirhabdium butyrativorans TaxID=340467 RepID=UPI000427B974|nr:hybrid sensor histidine kinase/response regulator [Desulfatirhabdium butyrativorans]
MEKTLLLVDDEKDFRESLALHLQEMGFLVYSAANGAEAIEQFRRINPLIVLMDVLLPDGNGLDLMRRMKAEIPDVEIIMITGFVDTDLIIKSFQSEATDFLTKPIRREALHHALDRAMKKIALRSQLHRNAEKSTMRDMVIKELINEDVMVIGPDYRILDVNGHMLENLDMTRDQVIGRYCYTITHHQDSPCCGDNHPCPLAECLDLQKPTQATHIHFNRNNEEIYYSISCYPIFENSRIIGAIELSRDITPEINKQKMMLQESKMASVGRLAAGVAHEINNPLTTILTTAMLMQEELNPGDPFSDDLELITKETLRCRKIVSALLDFARQRNPMKKNESLPKLIDEVVLLTRKQGAFKDVRVECTHCAADLPLIQMDRGQMQQALINLILNGIEATEPGGSVRISAELSGDRAFAEIQVQDTGCGIPEEDQKQLFDPFFTTKESGTGLGLAITSGIISQHGGTIAVSSTPGQGATFTIRLPLNPESSHAA